MLRINKPTTSTMHKIEKELLGQIIKPAGAKLLLLSAWLTTETGIDPPPLNRKLQARKMMETIASRNPGSAYVIDLFPYFCDGELPIPFIFRL